MLFAQFELPHVAQQWAYVALIWIGFGSLAGLIASLAFPFKQPTSPARTLLVGILGSSIGLFAYTVLAKTDAQSFNPISLYGFLSAVGGAFVLLLLTRVCQVCFVKATPDKKDDDADE